jgi:hypothetical protein
MKKLIRWVTTISCVGLLGAGTLAARAPAVKNRQITQQKRIRQGVRGGELTPRETRKLERNAARIHRSVSKDRVDGGAFTPHERAKAQRKLNKQSRKIYREKHDNQTR